MIDPVSSLAFSMHANKGVFAVMLGSGVSRPARIPTGWEITIELVRKVAALAKADCEPDPAAWYRTQMGKEPDYSELLDAVAKTPAERQQLLRSYWEPTEQEREEGAKTPTATHRAIAELVKRGYIRVILMTNFDRLQETALHDLGIQPVVLSSPDHIEGALPLAHTPCTVIKIHGDYLDTRIRNTPDELAAYPEAINKLLDRVFDEFGLIVAGWSAEWDEALRAAITRAPTRRFSTYWTSRGDPADKALQLIAHRGAIPVKVTDADTFFTELLSKVQSLEEFDRPHPLSTEAAVATLKRYLSESKYRIALTDLISLEVGRTADSLAKSVLTNVTMQVDADGLLKRLRTAESAMTTVIHMAFVAGQWAEGEQVEEWCRALRKLATLRGVNGLTAWLALQRYPASLLWYAFGVGAASRRRWQTLHHLFNAHLVREGRADLRGVDAFPAWAMMERNMDLIKLVPELKDRYTPLQDRLAEVMTPMFSRSFESEDAFQLAFDWFEVLSSLAYAAPTVELDGRYWTLPGSFGWRKANFQRIAEEIKASLEKEGAGSAFVTTGLVAKAPHLAAKNLASLEEFVGHLRWGW